MRTLTSIEIEATKLYNQLELGNFFDTYHDMMYELLNEFNYLEDDIEGDYKIAEKTLAKFKAIIKAQTILNNVNIS
jgi:hypothetical protein